MSYAEIEGAAQHGPGVFKIIDRTEVVPEPERDGRKLDAAPARAAVLHGIVTMTVGNVHGFSPEGRKYSNRGAIAARTRVSAPYDRVSIVLLVADGGAVPAQALEQFAICLDHLVEAADIGVHVFLFVVVVAMADDFLDVLLDIAAQAPPFGGCATQGRKEMKVCVSGGEPAELIAIVKIRFCASTEQQP